jgi:outer membrane protein assembly factor BamB
MTRLSIIILLAAMLGACGSPSNVDAPAELKSFKKLYRVDVDWKKNVGSMVNSGGRMRAAFADGSIFVIDDAGQVSSLDSASGKLNWVSKLEKQVSTGITVGDSLLAFATRNGDVIAVSVADGSIIWSANVLGAVLSVPAIGNGKVYVQTEDGRIIALSERDGSVAWTVERTVPALSLHGNSGSVYAQGLLVAGFANGHVVGIDSRNGRVLWDRVVSYPTGRSDVDRLSDVDAPPVIEGFRLFAVSYQGKIMAMDLRNGQVLWTRPMSVYLPFSADNRNLYVVNDEGVVLAISQANGANVWVQNDLKRRISTRPMVYEGKIILGDKEGYIHILDSSNGDISGRYSGDGSRVLSHLVANGKIYSLTDKGQLIAYTIKAL